MKCQKTAWGQIEWMNDGKSGIFGDGMYMGVVTLDVGARQFPHIHYEEQALYIIQGQAVSYVDGEEVILTAGKFFQYPVGIRHEVINVGNIPFQHLLISNTVSIDMEPEFESEEENDEGEENFKGEVRLLCTATEAIRTQFLETLPYTYCIFDKTGNTVNQGKIYSGFCTKKCHPLENQGRCPCMVLQSFVDYRKEVTISCPYGMDVFCVPIFYRSHFLGHIQGGYILQSKEGVQGPQGVYDVPKSTALGIWNLLRKIAKAIRNYCEFQQYREELTQREIQISNTEKSHQMLIRDLKNAEYAMTDLKINNHFLFNTLNSMASMALEGKNLNLYRSILDLSKMFQYTLRNQEAVVSLGKELEYVKAYLQLQKIRYGEKLVIRLQADEKILQCRVPFNFLQPVVENAFIHGFLEKDTKYLSVIAEKMEHGVKIQVKNSGREVDAAQCKRINEGMMGSTGHGLSMVYHKLYSIYGEQFQFQINSERKTGTVFVIEIPDKIVNKENEDGTGSNL